MKINIYNPLKKTLVGILTCGVCVMLLTVLVGCDYEYKWFSGNSEPRRQSWNVSGNIANPHLAVDGNTLTAATGGDTIIIDQGKPRLFGLIALQHGQQGFGNCRRLEVFVSADGEDWGESVYIGCGARKTTNILLWGGEMERYVMIRVVEPGDEPWSISEVYLISTIPELRGE